MDGAILTKQARLQIQFPGNQGDAYLHQNVVIHFRKP